MLKAGRVRNVTKDKKYTVVHVGQMDPKVEYS